MELTFDPAEVTIGDLETIEDICGKPYEQIDFEKPSAKLIKALIFISQRRVDPKFTLEDATNVKLGEVTTAVNPTPDGGAS